MAAKKPETNAGTPRKTPTFSMVEPTKRTGDEDEGDLLPFYVVRATILYTNPPIWRRIIVPSDNTFDEFAGALFGAFSWYGDASYYFVVDSDFIDDPLGNNEAMPHLASETHLSAEAVAIGERLHTGSSCTFNYDPEDLWELAILIEDEIPDEEMHYPYTPICLDGARMAPFEGVGGPIGYTDFCQAMLDEKNPYHAKAVAWANLPEGVTFDPEAFSPYVLNEDFALDKVDAFSDELLPKDADTLRELCITLMARDFAVEANMLLMLQNMDDGTLEKLLAQTEEKK